MNQSKNWQRNVNQLCGEIGPDDGIDPRTIARAMDRKSSSRKGKQLGKEAKQTVSMIFSGELSDPVFQDIEVIDVSASEDGQFLCVSLTQADTDVELDELLVLEKCQAVQGFLRSAIAETVKRKRVPTIRFDWIPLKNEVSRNAYSKDN
ncbi:MAG: ribosome-binding factor A [Aestuariibacter sp.]|nr:ribosome-binding factor A [Aestuariibacter sp.]